MNFIEVVSRLRRPRDPYRSPTEVMPNRLLRYRIVTLLTVTMIAAAAFSLARSFDPTISFLETKPALFDEPDGSTSPTILFSIRNDGRFPVWLHREDGNEYGGIVLYQYPPHETADWVYLMERDGDGDRLDPGEIAVASIPFDSTATRLHIDVDITDWRGRVVTRTSPAVNPALMHKNAGNNGMHRSTACGFFSNG